MKHSQITGWCHEIMKSQIKENGLYIDATMGRGNDTLFFCRLAGQTGKVIAFDVQKDALKATEKLLDRHGVRNCAELILAGHEHMDEYAKEGTVDAVCFNFGYLPGGDHKTATAPATSIEAVRKGLVLLKAGGMMSLCIYSGGDTGFEEKQSVLSYLETLSSKEYTVIVNQYHNRNNNPPVPVFIFKEDI